MKFVVTAIVSLVFISAAWAQKVDLKDLDTQDSTTIEIRKGKGGTAAAEKCQPVWEVVDGTSDISGEPGVSAKDANQSWKKACDAWKKEFRADNKGNNVISAECGVPSCSTDAGSRTCVSTAKYKVKTRLD